MPSIRYPNPDLQARFLAEVREAACAVVVTEEGAVVFGEEQRQCVIEAASKVRDSCFKWYLSWCDTSSGTREFEEHLKESQVPYELEYHEDKVIFVLPKEDREKHHVESDIEIPTECSFCGVSHMERDRFFGTESVAICGDCIKWMYEQMQSEERK